MRGCWLTSELGHIDIAEEPTALIGHGGVCEGGGSCRADRASSTRKHAQRAWKRGGFEDLFYRGSEARWLRFGSDSEGRVSPNYR